MAEQDPGGRLGTILAILRVGVVPLFHHADIGHATQIVAALNAGGANVIEFTDRGDRAWPVFTDAARHFATADPGVVLGAGSIRDAATAALYVSSGARFIVGPNFNPEVARLCNRRRVPYLPGCATASEISDAEELGVEIVKIFPGDVVGPGFIRAIHGPMPATRVMVTGGVRATRESVTEWMAAGAACLGFGSALVDRPILDGADPGALTERVAALIAWVAEARSMTDSTSAADAAAPHPTEGQRT